jgi:hypothetical protein
MQKFLKHSLALASVMIIMTSMLSFAVLPVQAATLNLYGSNTGDAIANTGLGNKSPVDIASSILNVLMGFLGIIAVVIILMGGFKWMTAGGGEDKIAEAKKMITAGIIGLLIILAAWGITTFVISTLITATGATTP